MFFLNILQFLVLKAMKQKQMEEEDEDDDENA
jgi:hypothetical protein